MSLAKAVSVKEKIAQLLLGNEAAAKKPSPSIKLYFS
jgi:hypothetical protein